MKLGRAAVRGWWKKGGRCVLQLLILGTVVYQHFPDPVPELERGHDIAYTPAEKRHDAQGSVLKGSGTT